MAEFRHAVVLYLAKNKQETKFTYALEKMIERTNGVIGDFQKRKRDMEVDFAMTREDKSLIFDIGANGEKIYRMTAELTKEYDKATEALFAKENLDVEPYIAAEIPDDLRESFRPHFEGFVL